MMYCSANRTGKRGLRGKMLLTAQNFWREPERGIRRLLLFQEEVIGRRDIWGEGYLSKQQRIR